MLMESSLMRAIRVLSPYCNTADTYLALAVINTAISYHSASCIQVIDFLCIAATGS